MLSRTNSLLIDNMRTLTRILLTSRLQTSKRSLRFCSDGSDSIYQVEKVTNKLLDANTLYQLDKYSK